MERYTFDEIKNFKQGDVFWATNQRWIVQTTPTYYNTSDFYGDYSEKVEWDAYCEETMREHKFSTHNIREGAAEDTVIFKTSVSEPMDQGIDHNKINIIGSSNE